MILGIGQHIINLVRRAYYYYKKFQKNAVEAKVSFVELIGRELHVHLATAKPTQRLEVGKQIWLTFDGRKIHIFDKKNPKRP